MRKLAGTLLLLTSTPFLVACGDDAVTADAASAGDLAASAGDLAVAPTDDLRAAGDDLATAPGDLAGGASPMMSFFITSERGSGNLGGLAGADARCARLAAAVGRGGRTWRAYLSEDKGGVNARDRIGKGPWYNAKGVKIADDVAMLHSANMNLTKMTALDERGSVVNGRGDTPNEHDIITGSTADGRLDPGATCADWTSEAPNGVVTSVGHHDRVGGGADPMSWNAAHRSSGCSAAALVGTGGAGHFYCFAAD